MTMSLIGEFQELCIDKHWDAFKTSEELESYAVDQSLGAVDRAVYILSAGHDVQRLSVVGGLPLLLKDHNGESVKRVVPKIREVLNLASGEMHVTASRVFLQVLADKLVPIDYFVNTFLQSILAGVDNKDSDIADSWIECLMQVLDILPKDAIRQHILPDAVGRGSVSKSIHSRIVACKILGRISHRLEPFIIRKDILPSVESLCQDIEHKVRSEMCQQLNFIIKGLGIDQSQHSVLRELVELSKDDESSVRVCAVRTVARLVERSNSSHSSHCPSDHAPSDTSCPSDVLSRNSTSSAARLCLLPLVRSFLERDHDPRSPECLALSSEFGLFCVALECHMTEEEKKQFTEYYKLICSINNNEVDKRIELLRINAAFNFSAMTLFCGQPKYFLRDLLPTMQCLCNDRNADVRKTMAASFHEVIKILGNSASVLFNYYINLLCDQNLQVLSALMIHCKQCIRFFYQPKLLTGHQRLELSESIQACGRTLLSESSDWRSHVTYYESLEGALGHHVDRFICSLFGDLFTRKRSRALPVRQSILRCLLLFLRDISSKERQADCLERMHKELAQSPSCHYRNLYIDLCDMALKIYSRAYFKEHFAEQLLMLALDPISNVRLKLCRILPKIKKTLNFPADKVLLEKMEKFSRMLSTSEKNSDVIEAIDKCMDEMDEINLRVETSTRRKEMTISDDEDLEKEEFEIKIQSNNERIIKASKIPTRRISLNKETPKKSKIAVLKKTNRKTSETKTRAVRTTSKP